MDKPLSQVSRGSTVFIDKIGSCCKSKLLLEELGFLPGTEVTVFQTCGEAMILKLRKSNLMLGLKVAEQILVKEKEGVR